MASPANQKGESPLLRQVIGAVLTTLLGLSALLLPFGDPLARLSYDLPFVFRTGGATGDIVLVYLDESSARALQQPLDGKWDRALHVLLLNRLSAEGARAVFFDIVFSSEGVDPATDHAFAEAMKRQPNVVIGGTFDVVEQMGVSQQEIIAPLTLFRRAAAGWGVLAFKPVDPDYGVRILPLQVEGFPTSVVVMDGLLHKMGGNFSSAKKVRWLNFQGPPGHFPSSSFSQALLPDGVPPGFFKNKIVVVGARPAASGMDQSKDLFANPWSRWGDSFTPGMEIHATALLNLLQHDWLTRISIGWEAIVVALAGLIAGWFYPQIRVRWVLGSAAAAMIFFPMLEIWLFARQHYWGNWLIPVAIQIPIAAGWGLTSRYFLEMRRRTKLRHAFSLLLSPEMADEIANSQFDLRPGGKLVQATAMFTDLQGFTALSEDLNDPQRISDTLIAYFTQASQCVMDQRGTIIKYIGDAVFASWGAPVKADDHARQAMLAACALSKLQNMTIAGRQLITRVGVHSGIVLAGNLGSHTRFDYTIIGDPVNLASRLEGLNKYLGTCVLVSRSTWELAGAGFIGRFLGDFRVAGKHRSIPVMELFGEVGKEIEPDWYVVFAEGIKCFRSRQWKEAKSHFQTTIQQRGEYDGPSEFYLKTMNRLDVTKLGTDWDAAIDLEGK